MKAQLVQYSYQAGDWDPCRGSREWTESPLAIFVPELNLLVLNDQWNHMYFFIAVERGGRWQFQPVDYDRNLPVEGFKVVKEIEVPDDLARTAAVFAIQLQSFRDARAKFDKLFVAERKVLWQEQREAEKAAAQPA